MIFWTKRSDWMKKIHSFQSISTLCCSEIASGRAWCWMREVTGELLPFHFANHITLVVSQFSWCDSLRPKQLQGRLCSANTPRKVQTSCDQWDLIWCPRKMNGSPPSLPAAVCDPRLAWLSLCQLCHILTLSPASLGRPLQDLKIHQTASDGFITTLIKVSENRDSEGEIREAIKLHSITSDFPGMGVFEGAPERTNFWQVHCSIRHCQRQCLRILRGLKAQQISCCALISWTLIRSEGRGDFSRNHSLSRYGATKSRMIARTVSLEVLLQRIMTIIQLIRIVLFRARVSEHFATSINFPPHPLRRSIIQCNQVQ